MATIVDDVREWVQRSSTGRVETKVGVISIETPVRRKHHEMFDFCELQKISVYAREQKYVSLWKCFNAASGAVLAGSHEFTKGLLHLRRMFGGGLPGAWPFAAVALRYEHDYGREYSRAWAVADEFLSIIRKDPRFAIDKVAHGTSAFLMSVKGIAPVNVPSHLGRLRENRIIDDGLPSPEV